MSHTMDAGYSVKPIDGRFMLRVFLWFALFAGVSAAILAGSAIYGRTVALGGHTDSTTPYEIVIGNNVLSIPANMLRFERQRVSGIQQRVELYAHWPDMGGYSRAVSADFNHERDSRNIIFLTLEEQIMSRDMSGRYEPIYSELIARPGIPGPGGLTLFGFTEKSGYVDELLAYAPREGTTPYVARCLAGAEADKSLAACERDLLIGDGLSLTYRFPKQYLGDWRLMDASILSMARRMLQTGS